MTRRFVSRIVFGSLLGAAALGACAKDDGHGKDDRSEPGLAVGDQMFPAAASTTEYATWGKERAATAVARSEGYDVALAYSGKKANGAVELRVGQRGQRDARPVMLAEGRPSVRPGMPAGSADLMELLPPAGTRLELHQPYDTPGPDVDYVLSQADQNRMVLWQQMVQVPTDIVAVGDKTLVRVEGRGVNRLHFVDDDGSIRSSDVGTAYLNVADLVSIPGQGWQVLRFARISDVEGAEQDPKMELATARTHAHATFVVCATRMDVAGKDLAQLHATLVDDVPEFAACK